MTALFVNISGFAKCEIVFRYRRRYYLVLYIGLSSFEIILVLLQPWTQTRSQTQKREHSKQCREYYKNSRKQQKKKKEKEERQCIRRRVKARSTNYKIQTSPSHWSSQRSIKEKKNGWFWATLAKGEKRMVSSSLQKNLMEKKQKEAIQVLATPKATEGTTFKELAPKNFVRDLRAWDISSTFGDYPGMYCGFSVVIKEYKETRELGFPFCNNKQDIRCMFCNNRGIILASHFCLVFY